jgi:hypothetical protein
MKGVLLVLLGISLVNGNQLKGKCDKEFDVYTFSKVLGSGASGTALLATKDGAGSVVLKVMLCGGALAKSGWQIEEKNYANIALITDEMCPLWTKAQAGGFMCEGLIKKKGGDQPFAADEALAEKAERVLDCYGQECCWSVLQTASGSFPYGQQKPNGPITRATALQTQVWMYQLLYALYAGWAKIAFQHWDLKEANVMVGGFPDTITKMCFYHTDAAGGGRCFTSAAEQANGKLLRMIDFDLSTSGGIGAVPRVKWASDKKDGTSLKAMFEHIRPEGVMSDAEKAFVLLLDAIIAANTAGNKDAISEDEYNAYATALSNALKSDYFADMESAPAPGTCAGAPCQKAVATAVYPTLLEERVSVHKSRLHQKVLRAARN